ncbi:MAG: hypothetical protein DIU61_009360 [Bacteroidota bacterium]|nr:MAG: hypothetical protein DIU61_14770 [Bacteroidota bacterium]
MQIRKNTKAHKSILQIVEECATRPDREKLVRLYITRAGHTLQQRISIDAIQGEADLLYDMTYQTVLNNLKSPNHQLYVSDDTPGIYYFHSSNKEWDETPFEFDDAVLKLFPSLPEPPATRKKEKAEKYVLPTAPKTKAVSPAKPAAKKKISEKKSSPAKKAEQQPNYRLKHKILFTNLDSIIFRHPQISKRDVLDYYDKVADHLLPHLKDRPITIYRYRGNGFSEYTTASSLVADKVELPDWIQTTGTNKEQLLLCNDRDHLFFFLEVGVVAFAHRLAKVKSPDRPDYVVITLGDDTEWPVLADAAHEAKSILDGLKLPSSIKWDGESHLHIYIPLDGKSDFETAHDAAKFICRLLKLKAPDLIILPSTENGYNKIWVNYVLNDETTGVVAAYSLAGNYPGVALPLSWDDITPDLKPGRFTVKEIVKLKKMPELKYPSKKVDARALLEKLEDLYGFLLE